MNINYSLLIVLVISIFVSGLPALAEEKKQIELGRIIVTPSRMQQYEYETTSNVTVIDTEDIRDSNVQNVADLLKNGVGINVSSYTSTRKTVQLDIRGFGETSVSNVLVLIDGRRTNQIDISGVDWWQIPVESVERIEIKRGSSSVLYGDNAVGGVINIITKKGRGKFSGSINSKIGSYSMNSHSLDISGSLDDFSYYCYGKYYDTQGYRDNNSLLSKDFNTRLGYDFSEILKFDLNVGCHEDSYGLPGALSVANLAALGRKGSAYPDDRANTKDKYIKFQMDSHPEIDSLKLGNFIIDISLRNRKTYSSLIAFGVNSTTQHDIDNFGLNIKNIKLFDIYGKPVKLVAGIDYYNSEDTINSRGWSTDDIFITKVSTGSYVHIESEILKDLIFSNGCRYEKVNYSFDQSSPITKYEQKNPHESVFSSKLQYNFLRASNFYISYEESFRFPATDEWYSIFAATGLNESLEPQNGKQYELGLKHRFDDMAEFHITSYLMDIENEIYYNPSTYANENYQETRHQGIEAGINFKFFDNVLTFLNFSYQKTKFKGDNYSGNEIPAVPNWLGNAGCKIELSDKLNLSIIGKYVGDRYMISDQKNQVDKLDYYFTIDGKLSYVRDNVEIFLGINNIFDEEYSEYAVTNSTGTAKNYYPAPERNFEVGISYRF